MLISDEEFEKLQELAEQEGLTVSDYVRQFIRQTHRETFGAPRPKRGKRRKK